MNKEKVSKRSGVPLWAVLPLLFIGAVSSVSVLISVPQPPALDEVVGGVSVTFTTNQDVTTTQDVLFFGDEPTAWVSLTVANGQLDWVYQVDQGRLLKGKQRVTSVEPLTKYTVVMPYNLLAYARISSLAVGHCYYNGDVYKRCYPFSGYIHEVVITEVAQ